MKLTLAEISELTPALQELVGLSIPISVSFRVSRMIQKLSEILKVLEEKRTTLVKKYGTENPETPGSFSVPPEKVGEFRAEFGALLSTEEDLPVEPIRIGEFGNVSVSPRVLLLMSKLIVE